MSKQFALITGANRGIGKAIASKLAEDGYNLILVARDKVALSKTEEELGKYRIDIHSIAANLLNPDDIQKVAHEVEKVSDELNVLVNNAGIAISKPVIETKIEEWDKIMNINARAPFFLTKACLPLMEKAKAPVIVNISSVVGRLGYEKQGAYAASKHALMGFSKVLAKELQPKGFRVHVLSPGGVATEMVSKMRPDIDTSELIQPEEIAEIVQFLIKNRGNAMIDTINIRRESSTPWA